MTIFRGDALPYVMGLLATVVGWYLTLVTEDLTARRTLIYDLSYDGAVVTLELLNASRATSIDKARIQVTCEDVTPDCLKPIDGADTFVAFRAFTPAAPAIPEPGLQSSFAVSVDVSLIAGSRVHLTLLRNDPEAPLLMFYERNRTAPQEILLVEAGTLQAIAIKHYFTVAFVVFAIALVTFVTFLAAQFVGLLRPGRKKDSADETAKPQHIVLHFAPGNGCVDPVVAGTDPTATVAGSGAADSAGCPEGKAGAGGQKRNPDR